MTDALVNVNRETGMMDVSNAERSRFNKDLAARTPSDVEARDAALKLSGLAILAFENQWKPDRALDSAIARHKLESEIEGVLKSPDKAWRTSEYLQALQPKTEGSRETKLWQYNNGGSGEYTYLPEVVFNLDDKGVNQICFGNKPFIAKTGASPYVAVCGDRK